MVKLGVVPPIVQTILQVRGSIIFAVAVVPLVVVPAVTAIPGYSIIPKLPVAVSAAVAAPGIS